MSHLVPLGAWSLWRTACLRATGFPARGVLALADDALGAAADRLLDTEAEVSALRAAALAACKTALERVAPDEERAVQRALAKLRKHRVPDALADATAETARQQLADAAARVAALEQEIAAHYARACGAASNALRSAATDDRFRCAVLWQNRAAVTGGLDWLLRRPAGATDSQTRRVERAAASYLQRYCVKNDTIGFFGPVGWARFTDGPDFGQSPGPSLIATRTIYYEYWAIDALAAKLSADPELRPFIAPRLLPRFRLDGTTLHIPIDRRAELPPEFAAAAARCDGARTAREIARELAADPELELAGEAEVFDVLDELVASNVIRWELEVPTAGPHPDRHLAALLARIDDAELRRRAEAALDELHRARAAIAAATDAAQLAAALAAFDAAFTRATDADSHRAHGQTYAGRTPLYEDCRRDLDVELGRPFLDRLAAPLELLLQSARWFTHEIAARYRRALAAIYRRLRGDDAAVDFARFWEEVPALFPGGAAAGSIVGDVRDELHRRWAELLAIDPAAPVVQRSAAALAGAVHRAFAAPGPGWPAARHHSPDVMIAAAESGALARGDYTIVVGELHVGFNTVIEPVFVKEHPAPEALIAARDADIGRACIAPVWSKAVTRGDHFSLSPRDFDLEHAETRSARPRANVLTTGELVVEERGDRLEVRTRDGAHRFDIIAFLEHHLIAESYAHFSPIASGSRTPRVAIDDVVIARAAWQVAPAELAWLAVDDPGARFLAARRWARSRGLPRWVFTRTPEEVKPVFVDFDSAIYVEMLARQLRGASSASLSEMLPTVEQAWVTDRDGARYTAELRIAAVDPAPWQTG